MTLRDYAQGAFRMRGIESGQKIELLLTPEVKHLMAAACQAIGGVGSAAPTDHQDMLVATLTWLTLNGVLAEEQRRHHLIKLNMHNLWRSDACRALEECEADDKAKLRSWVQQPRAKE